MTPHDVRLLPAAGTAWLSILLLATGVPTWAVVAVSAGLGVLAWVTAGVTGGRVATLALTVAVACASSLTATAAQAAHESLQTSWVASVGQSPVCIDAVVVDAPRTVDVAGREVVMIHVRVDRWRVQGGDRCGATGGAHGGEDTPADQQATWHPARAAVVLAVEATSGASATSDVSATSDASSVPRIGRGARVWALASFSTPQPRQDPVAWNAEITTAHAPTSVPAQARTGLVEASSALPTEVRGLVIGMTTGDTSHMPDEQTDAMRRSGLAHLTAVSGAHFATVTLVMLAIARRTRAPRWARASLIIVAAATFVAFVGTQPSVVRACGLALAVGVALALGRPAQALPALSATVLVLMHVFPGVATEVGFAMSVTAVVAIVVVAPHIARRLSRVLTPRLASAISIPVAAQAALLPFLVSFDPGINPYAVAANLAAAPFLLPVMLAGLGCAATSLWWPGLADALAHIAGMAALPIARLAEAAAQAPGSWWPWLPGTAGLICAGAAACLWLLAPMAGSRTVAASIAGVACAVSVIGLQVTGALLDRWVGVRVHDWDVVACDVGQGDMMMLRAGPDSAVVIDTGEDGPAAQRCLQDHGVTAVPLLVITHPDADHDGAVAEVMEVARVDNAWVSSVALGGRAVAELERDGVDVVVPADGVEARVGDVHLTVLPSAQEGDPVAPGDNDASIVVHAQARATAVLALGDLEPWGQDRLAAALGRVSVDVVKVAHHGSAHQSAALAGQIDAAWAIYSAGRDNDYGHPRAETVALYADRGAAPLVTAQCGDVILVSGQPHVASRCHTGMAR